MCKDSIAGLCKEADILKEIFFYKKKKPAVFSCKEIFVRQNENIGRNTGRAVEFAERWLLLCVRIVTTGGIR